MESAQLDEVKVRVFGDAAVVGRTEKSRYKAKDSSGQYRVDTWLKRDRRLRLLKNKVAKE